MTHHVKRFAGRNPIEYAERLARDESLRKELRSAGGHAAALIRVARHGTARQFLARLRDSDVQKHALALVGNIDRAAELVETRAQPRKRHTLLTVVAALGVGGAIAAFAKSMLRPV